MPRFRVVVIALLSASLGACAVAPTAQRDPASEPRKRNLPPPPYKVVGAPRLPDEKDL